MRTGLQRIKLSANISTDRGRALDGKDCGERLASDAFPTAGLNHRHAEKNDPQASERDEVRSRKEEVENRAGRFAFLQNSLNWQPNLDPAGFRCPAWCRGRDPDRRGARGHPRPDMADKAPYRCARPSGDNVVARAIGSHWSYSSFPREGRKEESVRRGCPRTTTTTKRAESNPRLQPERTRGASLQILDS